MSKMTELKQPQNYKDPYNKTFAFVNHNKWQLPETCFTSNHWEIPSLQALKHQLNETKEKLSNYDLKAWSLHTKNRDISTQIFNLIRKQYNPELLTQAWCKFYECLSRYDLTQTHPSRPGKLYSLHLCEAPGGFISALNHFLKSGSEEDFLAELEWYATTLNPNYEGNPTSRMIPDDRLIVCTRGNWLFGADNTGDLLKHYNHLAITKEVMIKCPEKIDLITADGSIDCMSDPGNQEKFVEHLHFCEVVTAIRLLRTGGNFVLKIFTTFEDSTISLLYFLNCTFEQVSIIKPIMSKAGNSETYVICQSFKGLNYIQNLLPRLLSHYKQPKNYEGQAFLSQGDIPHEFFTQIEKCARYFMLLQIETIEANIVSFGFYPMHISINHKTQKHNYKVAKKFFDLYEIFSLGEENRLVQHKELKFLIVKLPLRINTSWLTYNVENTVKLNIVTGKGINQVLYTKYADVKRIRDHLKVNIFKDESLFKLCRGKLLDAGIVDCNDFSPLATNQSVVNRAIFRRVYEIFSKNSECRELLCVNIGLLSNFLVGLIFVLSEEFTIHFCKHGVLYLTRKKCSLHNHTGNCRNNLSIINETLINVTPHHGFNNDVLELVDYAEYDENFKKFVYFYNYYLSQ